MITRIWPYIFITCLMAGCANQASKDSSTTPSWVMGESEQYPRKRFLLGVGEADTMSDAKSRARAEIAKIFNVTIDAQSSDSAKFETNFSADSGSQGSLSVAREIRSKTHQLLEGVEIAETWLDPSNQRYYALATLGRLKSSTGLRSTIDELDNATHSYIERSRATDSIVKKVRMSAKAVQLQAQRHGLNKQLMVVSALGQGVDKKWSLEELKADHAKLLSRIQIRPVAAGPKQSALQTTLENALANQGFSVANSAPYQLHAKLDSSAIPPRNGWYYENATLTISLRDENDNSLGGHEWAYKVSATESSLTNTRVLEKAKALLNTELSTKLFEFMEAK